MILKRLPGRNRRAADRLKGVTDGDLLDTLESHGNSMTRMAASLQVNRFSLRDEFKRRGAILPKPDHWRRRLGRVQTAELDSMVRINHHNLRPVAEAYGLSTRLMKKELDRRGIKTGKGVRKASWSKDILYDLYVAQKKSLWQVAEFFGVSACAIRDHLQEFGIPRRPFRNAYGGGPRT